MTEISAEMVEAAARSLCKEDGQDPDQYRVRINGPRWHYYRGKARAALTAALAVRESTHVWVPREPGADFLLPGIYAVADILCASEYVNAPDASFVLALAHRAFADGYAVVLAGSPQPEPEHDPTNPFAPRARPKKSIRLMTDAERRAAGLDPNGGFDGPTGAN